MVKIRWKQHELIFVSLVISFVIINAFLEALSSGGEATGSKILFEQKGIHFDYLWNYLLPVFGPLLALYAFYLLVNLYLLPHWYYGKKSVLVLAAAAVGIYSLLSVVFTAAYRLEAYYLLYENTGGELTRLSVRYGLSISGAILLTYLLYLLMRETVIALITRQRAARDYYVTAANAVTLSLFGYFTLIGFCWVFKVFRSDSMGIFLVFFLLPVIVNSLINIFLIFPSFSKKKLALFDAAIRISLPPLLLALISYGIFISMGGSGNGLFMLAIWLLQLVLAAPLSWWIYLHQRNRLSTIKALQKDLGQTTADLQFLRSQINPHFLFNALNTIYGTAIQENAHRAAEGIQRLGEMMRFMLEENHQERILLSREINYLKNYIDLQKLRTVSKPGITVQTQLDVHAGDLEIAPMLLIPFVENAFKHGVRLNKPSWISVSVAISGQSIHFDVHNSVHISEEDDPEQDHTGIGLENVQQRLQLTYPNQHHLQIRKTASDFFVHLDIHLD